MNGSYILGDGISGLIAKYYMPEYTIISKQNVVPSFQLGPQYLYTSRCMYRLLDELGLSTGKHKVRVGYSSDGAYIYPSLRDWKNYMLKTRGVVPKDKSIGMSNLRACFNVYDVTPAELVAKLRKGVKVRRDTITNIDLENKVMCGWKRDYVFDKLVVTIPRPLFDIMCGEWDAKKVNKRYRWNGVLFWKWEEPFNQIWDTKFDYVYMLDKKDPAYRVTKLEYPFVVREYIIDDVMQPGLAIYNLEFGKIVGSISPPNYEGVQFLGRWAQWEDGIKIHDVVREVQKWID